MTNLDATLARATEAQRRGDRAAAAELFQAVLAQQPTHPLAANALGNLLLASGDVAGARARFEQAVKGDPDAAELWNNLAKACRDLGDDDGERAALDAALERDARNFVARLRMAELHERRGEQGEAAQHWGGVAALTRQVEQPSPELRAIAARAYAFLAEHRRRFETGIAAPLAAERATMPPESQRRFDACVDASLGKRRIYVNECHGLHYPFLPADEFFERSHFPWMAALEAETDVIRAELEALLAGGGEGLTPYVQQDAGTPRNKWSELDRSSRWSAFFLWRHGERDDAACALCPATARAVQSTPRSDIPGRSPTVFFSLLEPHTRIPPHTGVTNTRAIIHLPLIVPPECGFRVGGETREWKVGEAFAFDDTIEHEAWNDSDRLRAVLILDAWNPHLDAAEQQALRTFFVAGDATGLNPARPAG